MAGYAVQKIGVFIVDQAVNTQIAPLAELGGGGVFRLGSQADPVVAGIFQAQGAADQLVHQHIQGLAAAALHGHAHKDQAQVGVQNRGPRLIGQGHGEDIVDGVLLGLAAQVQRRPAQAGIVDEHIVPGEVGDVGPAQQRVGLVLQQGVGAGADVPDALKRGKGLVNGLIQ